MANQHSDFTLNIMGYASIDSNIDVGFNNQYTHNLILGSITNADHVFSNLNFNNNSIRGFNNLTIISLPPIVVSNANFLELNNLSLQNITFTNSYNNLTVDFTQAIQVILNNVLFVNNSNIIFNIYSSISPINITGDALTLQGTGNVVINIGNVQSKKY